MSPFNSHKNFLREIIDIRHQTQKKAQLEKSNFPWILSPDKKLAAWVQYQSNMFKKSRISDLCRNREEQRQHDEEFSNDSCFEEGVPSCPRLCLPPDASSVQNNRTLDEEKVEKLYEKDRTF